MFLYFWAFKISCSAKLSMKFFYNLGAWSFRSLIWFCTICLDLPVPISRIKIVTIHKDPKFDNKCLSVDMEQTSKGATWSGCSCRTVREKVHTAKYSETTLLWLKLHTEHFFYIAHVRVFCIYSAYCWWRWPKTSPRNLAFSHVLWAMFTATVVRDLRVSTLIHSATEAHSCTVSLHVSTLPISKSEFISNY